ncbi:hypothetical protein ACFWNL_18185 [Kitasatospora sp. NPDC058397]|uniref:hypothetical protein n=1 Tax=unclassified Kitasatospora TaxID=2633591 RepID=UPI00364A244A
MATTTRHRTGRPADPDTHRNDTERAEDPSTETTLDTELPFAVEVSEEYAQAATGSLPARWANPYTPRRGEPAVRLASGFSSATRGNAGVQLEFADTSRRGPERRRLAATLGAHWGIYIEPVVTYRTIYVDTGSEITPEGRWRGTSERREITERRLGHGRTDARISAAPGDLARYCAILPILLDHLDRLSANWGRRCAAWLTGPGEHWCTPAERRTAVRHFRAEFAEALAYALATGAPENAEEIDPDRPFPHQSRTAALLARRELGDGWLDQVTRPETEAAYRLAATTVEQLAADVADRRAADHARADRERFEAELAERQTTAAQRAAEAAADRVKLTETQLAELDRLLHPRDYPADDEPGYNEVPLAAGTPVQLEAEPDAAELRRRAELLRGIGAHVAAEMLLDRAAQLDAEQQPAAAVEDLLAGAPAGRPHRMPRRRPTRAGARQPARSRLRPAPALPSGNGLRPPAAAVGRNRRSPVRGTGGALNEPRTLTRKTL